MKMKKILPIISIVILLCVFVSCSTSTDNTIVCNSCGEQISSLSKFCQFCGASLEIQGNPNDNNADDSKDETADNSQSDTSNSDDTNNENDSSEKFDKRIDKSIWIKDDNKFCRWRKCIYGLGKPKRKRNQIYAF